jgi:molybdopterin/thiamine biosynthesis adenylyltransferase
MTGITTVKQDEFISAEQLSRWKIKVFGLGSIGSVAVKQLALVGFKDIVGYDYDVVEGNNIGSQEYRIKHVDMKKTAAMKQIMEEDYNFQIKVVDGEITEDTLVLPEANTIYFCAFDSLGARKMLWNKIKNFPVVWAETRIGRTSQRYYIVDLRNRDQEWIEEYEATLDSSGPRVELTCGEKGCYPSNAELVAKLLKQFVNIAENKPPAQLFVGDWGGINSIYRAPEEEMPEEITYA